MSTFTALNVEPEENVEDEVDDTKEIQIEEAFKIYQNALKLHSQGSEYYPAAEEAYRELFASEVFKYPEVLSDFAHEQIDETVVVEIPSIEQEAPLVAANTADSAANSLPQLVYLAYKSRAQFVLDVARHESNTAPIDDRQLRQYYYTYCVRSMEDSASALERDDTDLDLWKKSARIADTLTSQRLARFCLESVLAGDDDVEDEAIDLSGLDEAFASGEMRDVLAVIQDDLTRLKMDAGRPKSALMTLLRQSNDPYPFLPPRSHELQYITSKQEPLALKYEQTILTVGDRSLASLGATLLSALKKYENGDTTVGSAGNIRIQFAGSEDDAQSESAMMDANSPLAAENPELPDETVRTITQHQPIDSPQSSTSFHSAHDEVQKEEAAGAPDLATDNDIGQTQIVDTAREIQQEDLPPIQDEVRLPSRKRSSAAAGLEEPESRTKSKRLRARESLLELAAQEEDVSQETHQYNEEQLRVIEDADEIAIGYLDRLLQKVDAARFGSLSDLRNAFWVDDTTVLSPEEPSLSCSADVHLADMRQIFERWTDDKSAAIMSGHNTRDSNESSGGLALFSRHLKASTPEQAEYITTGNDDKNIASFADSVSRRSNTLYEVASLWLLTLLSTATSQPARYLSEVWPTDFKDTVLESAIVIEEQLYAYLQEALGVYDLKKPFDTNVEFAGRTLEAAQVVELAESLFELYLENFVASTDHEGDEAHESAEQHINRLERWVQLVRELIQTFIPQDQTDSTISPVMFRFVWASTLYAKHTADSDKSHILACLHDFKQLLQTSGSPLIRMPNNTTMPQISVSTVEQEISRLSNLDFFMSVFDEEASDPTELIMKLEPILEQKPNNPTPVAAVESTRIHELRVFLDSGDALLKLFLWKQLQNAYTSISYLPKVVSCLLRSFEIIVTELQTERHLRMAPNDRQLAMLRWIRDGDDFLSVAINKIAEDPDAFELVDEEHFSATTAAIVRMLKLLHGFVLYDDSVRVGRIAAPTLRPSSSKLFEKSRDRLRDSYVRLWTLLFYLFRESTVQFPDRFERPADELAEYLRTVHNALGHRQYCKQCNKGFVKLVKNELLSLRSDIDYSQDIAQILYDMYQLKFSPGVGDADHGCIPELLRDKTTATSLVPLIMTYARKFNPKDLIKSDLKVTIDKIQTCLGQVKTSPPVTYNKKAISAFLKSAIDPQYVYGAVKGFGDLTTKPVQGDHAKIANTGWFMLLGQMSLAKFKSIKRVNPTGTDDLDTAATFLRHDLEHNMNNWLGWYRLAQVFDAKIEDSLIWNSTKLNESRVEIATLERSSINAYTMAIAVAMRMAEDTSETIQQLSEMFFDFASRLYGSSRSPLSMEAFSTDRHMRHLSNSFDRSMSKAPFTLPFTPYRVWRFAAALIRKRFRSSNREWHCQYILGKCLWKMFQDPENAKAKSPITAEDVIDAFSEAVEAVPKKEKSSDYILEPHYKLVSVIHKLVHQKLIEPTKAVEYLKVSQFSRGAQLSEDEQGTLEWEPYILDILKKLGHADKSNWHHRITARAAHVIYDDDPNIAGALGAKHQFTQQIFTKTMTMQVWKPEHERPGRHYVYTGRYLTFFVHLLDQLNDRPNMEQLVRRIRRKTTDFLDHSRVWEKTALTYVTMLRRAGKVPDGKERALFDKIIHEDFTRVSEKLEQWTHEAGNTSIYLDIIQDALELKKLNNSLMKGPAIDDLIGDSYACLYENFLTRLPPEDIEAPKPVLPLGTFINMTTESAPANEDRIDRMRLNNLLTAQVEGVTSGLSSTISTPAGIDMQTPPRATPPVEPIRVSTPSKPARIKTVTKREVQRKAEAALNRQASGKTPTLGQKPLIRIPSKTGSDSTGMRTPGRKEEVEHGEEPENDSRLGSQQPSVAGSIRASDEPNENDGGNETGDKADVDSELSELDDDEIESASALLMSHSLGRKRKSEGDDNDGDAEDEEREQEEEEEEDDDDDREAGEGEEENEEEAQDGDEEDNDGEGDGDDEHEDEDEEEKHEEVLVERPDNSEDNAMDVDDNNEKEEIRGAKKQAGSTYNVRSRASRS